MANPFLIMKNYDGKAPILQPLYRAKARSQVMKAYKRRQREKLDSEAKDNNLEDSPTAYDAWRAHRQSKRVRPRSSRATALTAGSAKPDLDETVDIQSTAAKSVVSAARKASTASKTKKSSQSTAPSNLSVSATNVYRAALIAAIAIDCFPSNTPPSSPMTAILASWAAPHSLALQAGTDAFALMSLAASTGNPDFVTESRRRHLAATMCLRQEMTSPDFDFDSVMGAAQLTLAWSAHGTHVEEGISWSSHVAGFVAILITRAKTLETASIHRFILVQGRHCVTMKCLVESTRLPMDERLLHFGTGKVERGSYEALMRVVLQMPGLLQDARTRNEGEEGDNDVDSDEILRASLIQTQEALKAWLRNRHSIRKKQSCTFLELLRDPQDIPIARGATLPFSTFLESLYHSFYWTCQLLLTEALLDLAEASNSHSPECEVIKEQADLYAAHLVKLIPFLWETAGGQSGKAMAVRGIFHFVIEWYERTGDEGRSKICKEKEHECRLQGGFLQWDQALGYGYAGLCWLH